MFVVLSSDCIHAQRPRFNQQPTLPDGVPVLTAQAQHPSGYGGTTIQPLPNQPYVGQPFAGQPVVLPSPQTQFYPGTQLPMAPTQDPPLIYAGPPGSGVIPGGVYPGGVVQGGIPGTMGQPPPIFVNPNQPLYNTNPYIPITPQGSTFDPYMQGNQWYGNPWVPPGTYFPGVYGYQQPTSGPWPNANEQWPSQVWARLRDTGITRLFERPRFRHTYIARGNQFTDMGINDAELATTIAIPNFLWTNQPLRMSPGFIFHFWDGPAFPGPFFHMPSKAYSTYLSFDYSTSWEQQVGGEINFTVGLYSDFREINSDSVRYTGVGLGWIRVTPNATLKVGVEYLDRLDVKLLPAGGLFIQPSPDVKLNLYFPRPKIAFRLPNANNFEVWGYAGAEYGGGSWTMRRHPGIKDQVDINDIRVFLGLEWLGPRGVTGFFEGGYVFERELVFKVFPNFDLDLSDSYMLRAGIAF